MLSLANSDMACCPKWDDRLGWVYRTHFNEVVAIGRRDWNFTTLEEGPDGTFVQSKNKVTYLMTADGRVKPSFRALRIYGSEKLQPYISALFNDTRNPDNPTTNVAGTSIVD